MTDLDVFLTLFGRSLSLSVSFGCFIFIAKWGKCVVSRYFVPEFGTHAVIRQVKNSVSCLMLLFCLWWTRAKPFYKHRNLLSFRSFHLNCLVKTNYDLHYVIDKLCWFVLVICGKQNTYTHSLMRPERHIIYPHFSILTRPECKNVDTCWFADA